jgi:hypothetical protein
MSDLPFHRRTWMTLEPIHAMVYFTPVGPPTYEAIGLNARQGYFASRAAAMGAASAEVVISTFFNFAPDLVRASIPSAWAVASPAAVLDARYRVVRDAFDQHCPDHVHSPATTTAAQLAKTIALEACNRLEGRPLFAGHASLPWPDDENPAVVLWHAQTLLREFRGDGHIVALVAEGFSGIDAHVTHIATGQVPQDLMRSTRAWSDDDFEASIDSLRGRGLIARSNEGAISLTEAGLAQRERIEALTDALAAAPYQRVGDQHCAQLRAAARPFAQAVVDAGLSPLRRLPRPETDRQ